TLELAYRLANLPFEHITFSSDALHTHFFEHFNRANVIVQTPGGNHFDALLLQSPLDEALRYLGRIALIAILRHDVITDLHGSLLVWPSQEAHTADKRSICFVDDEPIPDSAR